MSTLSCKAQFWLAKYGQAHFSVEDPIRVGYTGVEVVRGWNRVKHEGRLVWAQKPKTKPQGFLLASEMWAGLFLGRGDPIGVGYS